MGKLGYSCLLGCMLLSVWIFLLHDDVSNYHLTRPEIQRSPEILQPWFREDECTPVTRIFFLKVHKSGSSTAATIFQRFGLARNLNFVVPNRTYGERSFNYIGQWGRFTSLSDIMPLPEGRQYDILWNHVVYNRTAFRHIMPENTKYIAIIRQPFQQFVSAFEYHGPRKKADNFYDMTSHQHLIEDYLKHPVDFEYGGEVMSHTRNSLAYDFGFTDAMIFDKSLRFQYLSQLAQDFKLVMVLEYFDESLILLKRYFCWDTKDILYFHQNKNKNKKPLVFAQEHRERHKIISQADYDIYDYFYTIFWEKVWRQGPDFFSEVACFKQLLSVVQDHCVLNKTFHISQTVWHNNFTMDWDDCQALYTTELDLFAVIYSNTVKLNALSKPEANRSVSSVI